MGHVSAAPFSSYTPAEIDWLQRSLNPTSSGDAIQTPWILTAALRLSSIEVLHLIIVILCNAISGDAPFVLCCYLAGLKIHSMDCPYKLKFSILIQCANAYPLIQGSQQKPSPLMCFSSSFWLIDNVYLGLTDSVPFFLFFFFSKWTTHWWITYLRGLTPPQVVKQEQEDVYQQWLALIMCLASNLLHTPF